MKDFKVVQLKSGGPKMTIEIANTPSVHCVWFDSENNFHEGGFSKLELRLWSKK